MLRYQLESGLERMTPPERTARPGALALLAETGRLLITADHDKPLAPGTTHSPGPAPLISPAADHWPPAQGPDGHAGDSWAPGQVERLRGHASHPCWVMPVIRYQVKAGPAQGKGSVADR